MAYRLAPHVSVTDTDQGLVLLDEMSGRYWQLNATAAVVVRCLERDGSGAGAVSTLREAHPDAADRIADDVQDIVRTLVEARLVMS